MSTPLVLQGYFFKGSIRNEKFDFLFLDQNVCTVGFVMGELHDSLNSVNTPLKVTLFLLHICLIGHAFPLTILLRVSGAIAFFFFLFFFLSNAQKLFMVSIKIKMTVLQGQLKLAVQVKREFTKL